MMEAREYLREMVLENQNDPEYRAKFACWFPSEKPDTVNLLEVTPKVLDSGGAYFDAVNLALPEHVSGARLVRVILVTPDEFRRALDDPSTPGGKLIDDLRRTRRYEILLGGRTAYARALQPRPHAAQ